MIEVGEKKTWANAHAKEAKCPAQTALGGSFTPRESHQQTLLAIVLLSLAVFLGGCGLRDSQTLIRSLTTEDCQLLVAKVKPLCAATPPKTRDDNAPAWLRGSDIPAELAYLKPKRVYLSDSSAAIELWRGAAGDDTIYVMCDEAGIWEVSVHEGDLLKKDRLVWSSRQGR